MGFYKDFVWGAATASYQVEGGANESGRGLSIWDVFCKTPGKVFEMHSGETGCDQYHHIKEDVALMRQMGLKAYRFSVSWSRILPEGTGVVNKKGLAYYDELINQLIAHGIEPFVTIFHWDLPYELYKRGGWLNPDIVDWFADYTRILVEHFSNRVTHWITQNEPQCYIGQGYRTGTHAPGLELPWSEALLAAKHSMLAHGKAVVTIRTYAKKKPLIGYAPCGSVAIPKTMSPEDIEAARLDMFHTYEKSMHAIPLFVDPVILGTYPEGAKELYGDDLPRLTEEELQLMTQPLDFLGMNNYSGHVVSMGKDGRPYCEKKEEGREQTAMGWDIMPDAIYWCFRFMCQRYNLPMYVTENGMANLDFPARDGRVYDYQRIEFTGRYLEKLRQLVAEGYPIKGYFHWSLMDNFEWAFGYSKRFGMIYVDYKTGKRTVKESGKWYRHVIETNGEDLSLNVMKRGEE